MDLSQGRSVIEVVEGKQYEMLVIPAGFRMYRSMAPGVTPESWAKYFSDKKDPFPSFYGEEETAHYYKQKFAHGLVMTFETTRETKLFVLSNYTNIENLECHLAGKCGKGKTTRGNKKKSFLEALRVAVATTMDCHEQARKIEEMDMFYPLRYEIPNTPGTLKRCSVYDVDLEMARGICDFFKDVGCDGYIADELASGFGAKAPKFHREIALCFAPKVVRPVRPDGSRSSVSGLDASVPELMRKKSAKFYANMLKKDEGFRNIVDANTWVSTIITKFMSQYNDHMISDDVKSGYKYCIGGGFAWSYWVNNLSPPPKLTATEMKVFQSGYGLNLFYLTDKPELHGKAICDIYKTMEAIRTTLDSTETFIDYHVILEAQGVTVTKNANGKVTHCTPKKSDGEDMSLSIVLEKKDDAAHAPFHNMTIIRIDDVCFEKVQLSNFFSKYVSASQSFPLLNPEGLWTMQAVYPIYSDAWFMSYYRSVYINYIQSLGSKQTLENLAGMYMDVFGKWPKYDKDVYYDLAIRAAKMEIPELDQLLGSAFDQWVMKTLRPFINQCIVNIDRDLTAATGGAAKIFIAGGDSMRRYKKNITTTNDIDSKIYLPSNASPAMFNTAHDIVRWHMSGLTTFLINNKRNIFPQGYDRVYVNGDGSQPGVQFLATDANNLQFRLRYNEPNTRIPVNLYSIDYRSYVFLPVKGRQRPIQVRYNLAILDVVIAPYDKKVVPDGILQRFGESRVPVASLNFLLEDLRHTYENPDLAGQRYLKNKKKKDLARYLTLKEIHSGKHGSSVSSASRSNKPGFDVYESRDAFNRTVEYPIDIVDVDKYVNIFKSIIAANKGKSYKHIVPFDASIIHWKNRRSVSSVTSPSDKKRARKVE